MQIIFLSTYLEIIGRLLDRETEDDQTFDLIRTIMVTTNMKTNSLNIKYPAGLHFRIIGNKTTSVKILKKKIKVKDLLCVS